MIKVIDDFLSEQHCNTLYRTMIQPEFTWHMTPSVLHANYHSTCNWLDTEFAQKRTDKIRESAQMFHTLRNDAMLVPLFNEISNVFDSKIEILRIKANCLFRTDSKYREYYNTPHVDYEYPDDNQYSAVYYPMNTDGDTIIFNQMYGERYDELTIKERISPKKNRILIFDTNVMHTSSNPVDNEMRIIINLNFKLTN
jgi:hypothetical protein